MNEADPSLRHLLGALGALFLTVEGAVAARRAGDPTPDDPFRGLYLSDEEIDRLLDGPPPPLPTQRGAAARLEVEAAADEAVAAGATMRLRRLADGFGLDDVDVQLLLVGLAPDVDRRFERLYGYLHDDVTRRRASIGLGLELTGLSPASGADRRRLGPAGGLVAGGLVEVGDDDRPFLGRSLRVPDRVVAHLLGDDRPDPALAGLIDDLRPDATDERVGDHLAALLTDRVSLVYLRERAGASGRTLAADALARSGRPPLALDLSRMDAGDDVGLLARTAGREARLAGGGLVAGPVEALVERHAGAVRAWAELPGPVLLVGRCTWDPAWSRRVPLLVDVAAPTEGDRTAAWRRHLSGAEPTPPGGGDVRGLEGLAPGGPSVAGPRAFDRTDGTTLDGAAATAGFRLTAEGVARAVEAARLSARLSGEPLSAGHLRAGARAQNGARLEALAHRLEPTVGWEDLVLPVHCRVALTEIAARLRHRDRVLGEWGLRPGGRRGKGVTALFAGDSGTGKTMSAEVVAGDLGLDLYAVDLATVVDKYVGETEKNLERIFAEADGVNGVLLFDEADALFGKRSEVRDAHDRYANVEVAYLLQRMERFEGLAILATNLRANIDEAFARRLDVVVDFPLPDEHHRRLLWDRCLGRSAPRAGDLDLEFCAQRFELTGGNIRSITVTAAYLAAEEGVPVAMRHLVRATHREYRKLGRLCVPSEFGPYYELVAG